MSAALRLVRDSDGVRRGTLPSDGGHVRRSVRRGWAAMTDHRERRHYCL
jgi:hypothetical protein